MAEPDHLAWMERRNLRPRTIHERARVLARLELHLGHEPATATADELGAWWASLVPAGVGPSGRATYLSHVQQFYRWLIREGLRSDDPTTRLDRPKLPRRVPRPIQEGDLRRVLAVAPDPLRCWFVLAAFAGLRACEIAALEREDVLDGQDPPSILVADGKGGSQRVIPVAAIVVSTVLELAPGSGPVFPGTTAHTVSSKANRWLHGTAGLGDTIHKLRHRYGTRIYAESKDLRVTQEMLGHRNPGTTALYADWSRDAAASAADAVAHPYP